LSLIRRRLLEHLLPASVCMAALLALGLTPFFACWLSGYGFACPTQPDVNYYLQLAAQPYYSHALYLSDPMVPGGATFYPWLQYLPFVCLTRWLGLPIFWIQILWTIFAALGTGLTLYLFMWFVFRNRWLAAAITICVWADIDLGVSYFAHRFLFVHQTYMVASDLIAQLGGRPLLARPLFPFQWRLTNTELDLPFLFLQLLVTSIAREFPSRRNLILSGLVFALTFYVYFYLWTMIAAGLCLAMLIDHPGRRTYIWTLCVGVGLGWPQLAHDYLTKSGLSAEGVKYFWMLTAPNQLFNLSTDSPYFRTYVVIAEAVILGVWAIRRRHPALLLAWCMVCVGLCLSMANLATGIFIHNYHWAWLTVPLMHIVMVAMALDLIMRWKPRLNISGRIAALLVSAYLASGIYVIGSIYLSRPKSDGDRRMVYSEYNRQRLVPGVAPFKPDSVIAGDPDFVDLASPAERQRPLAGRFLEVNMVLDNEQRRIRFVLDQYLSGSDRDNFAALLLKNYSASITREERAIYLHTFDEISRDSDRFIDDLKVRYLVLRASQRAPTFLSRQWNVIQPGPYWQIWEWTGNSVK
jgi:hypothetical protein